MGEKSVFNFTLYSFIKAFVNTSMLLQAENNALYSILWAIKAIQKQNPSIRVAINCKNIIIILSGPISSISVVTSRRATINTLRSMYMRRLRWISLMLLHKMVWLLSIASSCFLGLVNGSGAASKINKALNDRLQCQNKTNKLGKYDLYENNQRNYYQKRKEWYTLLIYLCIKIKSTLWNLHS